MELIRFDQATTNSSSSLAPMTAFLLSDEMLGSIVPIAVYWIYSGIYITLGDLNEYRLHSKDEEDKKNVVSKRDVVKGVLLQQALQLAVCLLLFTGGRGSVVVSQPSLHVLILQLFVGMVTLDSWSYFTHRLLHANKFLYKHIHSWHHALVVTYSFGALYNHPMEGIFDTIGGVVSFLVSGMTPRSAIYFFSFATIKSVDVHCGMWLPGNLLQILFKNNSAYHDIHHQIYGTKYNFAQFFATWDKILGTYMPFMVVERKEGGFEVRPITKVN